MTQALSGKVAIVTGGAGGIGQAYAQGLASAGAAVVIADINAAAAKDVASRMTAEGMSALAVGVDVTDPGSAQSMVEQAAERFGGLDILVNNAGIMSAIPKGGLLEVSLEAWTEAMRVNAMSVLVCSRAAVPAIKLRGGGRIVNQASTAAFEAGSLYRLSKHAVVGITAGLAKELGPSNITVNAIAPGMIGTEEGYRSAGAPGSAKRLARAKGVPNPRPDRPAEDLVGTLLLLASPGGDFINGQTIIVDGGRNMRL